MTEIMGLYSYIFVEKKNAMAWQMVVGLQQN